MAILEFNKVGITAMAGAVPKKKIKNLEYTDFFTLNEIKEIVEKIGVNERRFADENTCSSDLCCAAAEKLFADNMINRNEVDLLVFVSQTPDYRMPATAILLQHRLNLPIDTIAFDLTLGCSGFIYGLAVLFSFMEKNGLRKALLLNGETRSKVYSAKDRRVAFLFGDAGIAALVERNKCFEKSIFSLNSDGSRGNLIMIKGGGYRYPSSMDTLKEKTIDEYGNIRNDEQGFMNGGDVFNFVIQEIPKNIKNTLLKFNIGKDEIDYFVFHQANKFINSYLSKKLKLDPDKIPSTIEKFGNTSSVSVPITIVSELKEKLSGRKRLLLSAFGVGMSWATSIINFEQCRISDIVEVENYDKEPIFP